MKLKKFMNNVNHIDELQNLKVRVNGTKVGYVQIGSHTSLRSKKLWVSDEPDEFSAIEYPVESIEVLEKFKETEPC